MKSFFEVRSFLVSTERECNNKKIVIEIIMLSMFELI